MKETVQYVADLARLEFTDHELDVFASQFQDMLDYVGIIEKIDLENVEPLIHILQTQNVFREDVVEPSLSTKNALINAPKHNEVFFKVPKVLK